MANVPDEGGCLLKEGERESVRVIAYLEKDARTAEAE